MTKEGAVKALKAIDVGDTETAHSEADNVLLEFLATNRFNKISDAWLDVDASCDGFWYA